MEDLKVVTEPAPYLVAPSEEELKAFLQRSHLGEGTDLSVLKAAQDAASFALRGDSIDPAFLDPATTEDPVTARVIQQALKQVDFSSLSGRTPLERARAFLQATKAAPGGMDSMISAAKKGNSLDDQLKAIANAMSGIAELKKNKFASKVMGANEENIEAVIPTLSWDQTIVLNALGEIKKIGAIKSRKKSKPRIDLSGNIRHSELITDHSEIPLISNPSDMLMPDFDMRFANLEIMVNRKYTEDMLKRVVFLLFDASGSMWAPWKQGFVKAIMLHYFDMIADEGAQIYVANFVTEIDKVSKITTISAATNFYNKYRCPGGGDTDINSVIEDAQAQIASLNLGGHIIPHDAVPEICIVNDGQDRLDYKRYSSPIHAITLEVRNEKLKRVCEDSGGSYSEFGNVRSYDEEGPALRR